MLPKGLFAKNQMKMCNTTAIPNKTSPFCLSPFSAWPSPGIMNEKIPFFREFVSILSLHVD
jgi:hypothetical protein